MTENLLLKQEEFARKQELAQALEDLYEKKKQQKAASSLKDFCEYVIKDESSGKKIVMSELQLSWLDHIDFCEAHGLHALILAPMSCLTKGHRVLLYDGTSIAVEDVAVGMELLGPDGEKRTVLSTHSGNQPTVEVLRGAKDKIVCSTSELLVVYDSELNTTYPIEVGDLLADRRGINNFKLLTTTPDTSYRFCSEFWIHFPKNNINMVYGFELDGDKQYLLEDGTIMHNSGKCVSESTVFNTKERGAVSAGELTESDHILAIDYNQALCWGKVAAVEKQPKKPTVKIVTEKGRKLTCTSDHKVLTRIGWIEARALGPGNYIYVADNWSGLVSDPLTINPNVMYTLGAISGCSIRASTKKVNVPKIQTACKDSVVEFYEQKYYANGSVDLFPKAGHTLQEFISDAGLPSSDVYASLSLLDAVSVRAFLAGLLDTTGYYSPRRKALAVSVTSVRKAALLQMALLTFGIDSSVKVSRLDGTKLVNLLLNKRHTKELAEVDSLFLDDRMPIRTKTSSSDKDKLDRVVSISNKGSQATIGVEVEDVHTHVTNGIITHNTQIISIALPLFLIGKNPGIRMALVNISDDNAIQRLGAIASYILEDEDYHKVFPHVRQKKGAEWTKHKITVERQTKSKDPTIAASGVLSGGIGARLDKLLVDDIFDYRTGVAQPATRQQICDTYKLVWLSRLEPTETATIICTRWHERDLAGEILNDPAVRDRYGILIQAVKEDFTGIECKVIVPERLKEDYLKRSPAFSEV